MVIDVLQESLNVPLVENVKAVANVSYKYIG